MTMVFSYDFAWAIPKQHGRHLNVSAMVADSYANRFLDQVAVEIERLAGEPALVLPTLLRPVVRRTLLSIRPDGTWPESILLQEALRAYVDLVDSSLAGQNVGEDQLSRDDRRWLDACRQSSESIDLFDDMLHDLRADIPMPGPSTGA
jgi:hypothetical protein